MNTILKGGTTWSGTRRESESAKRSRTSRKLSKPHAASRSRLMPKRPESLRQAGEPEEQRVTIGQAIDEYLDFIKAHRKQRTYVTYRYTLDKLLRAMVSQIICGPDHTRRHLAVHDRLLQTWSWANARSTTNSWLCSNFSNVTEKSN